MKRLLTCGIALGVVWIALAEQPVQAQANNPPRAIEDILKPLPQQDFLKLRGQSKEKTAMELSSKLIATEVGKDGTYRVKIGKIENWPFPQEGITGWRITADDEKVRVGSLSVDVNLYVYIRQDPTGTAAKLKRGQTLLVTGKLSRCDLTAKDGPVLNMDLQSAALTVGK